MKRREKKVSPKKHGEWHGWLISKKTYHSLYGHCQIVDLRKTELRKCDIENFYRKRLLRLIAQNAVLFCERKSLNIIQAFF